MKLYEKLSRCLDQGLDLSSQNDSEIVRYLKFLEKALPQLKGFQIPFWRKTRHSKLDTLRYCLSKKKEFIPGLVLEFGVYKGTTIRMISKAFSDRKVYGFDSFEGFPEDGRGDWKSDFSVGDTLPRVPENVFLVKGFFDQTLPGFLQDHKDVPISFLHIDCDIYSSTKTIFELCGDRIGPDTIIVFDELLHYPGFLNNEMLALFEYLEENEKRLEWIAIRGKIMGIDEFLQNYGNHPSKMAGWRKLGYEQEVALRIV